MTLRSSDFQSYGDLDSIRNSCDVFLCSWYLWTIIQAPDEVTPARANCEQGFLILLQKQSGWLQLTASDRHQLPPLPWASHLTSLTKRILSQFFFVFLRWPWHKQTFYILLPFVRFTAEILEGWWKSWKRILLIVLPSMFGQYPWKADLKICACEEHYQLWKVMIKTVM